MKKEAMAPGGKYMVEFNNQREIKGVQHQLELNLIIVKKLFKKLK